ncbi:hypothetical protein [Chengkuizengella sediminis]|uniref:hypothetical protein n=1 Tax=Chengkuizengella sediminis TaxID=1885917 RepID=UPI001389BBF2|nr:hypothetical protein [Chengkuizengella sediminis]NDI36222.1 hypothetical protein [Chengkuizengella sediminis]
MAGFKKGPDVICDFRDVGVTLTNLDQVILEVKVCVRDPKKDVKLDWSVCEFLTGTDSNILGIPPINPTATVRYNLCRDGDPIASQITSALEIRYFDILGGIGQSMTFNQNSQPNFTFCDTPPKLGVVCYQLKARIEPTPDPSQQTSRSTVADRSLAAVCIDRKPEVKSTEKKK